MYHLGQATLHHEQPEGSLSGQIPHPRSSRLKAVGHRENNCVFRLRQSSGAQFYLFHSAAPNFKREPTATAVVGRNASREILTGSNAYPTSHVNSARMCQRNCDANATRTDTGQAWNGMHLRYGGQRLFWQRDPQSRSDNQAHAGDIRSIGGAAVKVTAILGQRAHCPS